MGTYSTWEFYETFGGWPEPGETYPDDPDAVRDQAEEAEEAEEGERDPCPECGYRHSPHISCDDDAASDDR